jgi:hypothetical protein
VWLAGILPAEEVPLTRRDARLPHRQDARATARWRSGFANRRENSIGDLFLACAVKIRDVNGVIAFESDALIGRKRSYAKTG